MGTASEFRWTSDEGGKRNDFSRQSRRASSRSAGQNAEGDPGKEIRPVASTRRIPTNVRILAATNRDLEQAVTQGEFCRDLYFRPTCLACAFLRCARRHQDIPLLIGYFLERMTRSSGLEKMLSDDALKAMLAYDWPGNVRELENCLERTYAFTRGPLIPHRRSAS